MLILTRASIN